MCPPEFKGEHCELLNQGYLAHPHVSHEKKAEENDKAEKPAIYIIIVCIGALSVMGLVLIRKVRRNHSLLNGLPQPPNQVALTHFPDSDMFSSDSEEDESNDLPSLT